MTKNKSAEVFRSGLLVFVFALCLRFLVFSISTPTWINVDEFHYLSRGKMISNGLLPYTDFIFSYPTGAALLFTLQHFLLEDAWILTRVFTILVDACNSYLIFRLATFIYNKKAGVIAALIYIMTPIAIFTNMASLSESYNLLFILTALKLLYREKPKYFFAGYCLAFSLFIKYYTLLFLLPPLLYFTHQNPKSRNILVYTPLFFILFLLVSVSDVGNLIQQTLINSYLFQECNFFMRIYMVILFLVFLQPHVLFAFKSFFKKSFVHLWWYSSLFYLIFPRIFEHNFMLTLPASCMIAGNYFSEKISSLPNPKKIFSNKINSFYALTLLIILISFFLMLEFHMLSLIYNINPQHRFEKVSPVVTYIKEHSSRDDFILSDYGEYTYLAQRKQLLGYMWGYRDVFTSKDLISNLGESSLIVVTYPDTYPPGFIDYLEREYDFVEFEGGICVFQKQVH